MNTENFNAKDYWEDRLIKHKGLKGVGFTSLGSQYNKYAYKARKRCFINSLSNLGLSYKNMVVGDVGSGIGFWIKTWGELGAKDIYGFDLTEVAVKELKEKYPNSHFYQLDITKEIPEDLKGKFDIISCMDVLFHIVDNEKYLKAVQNIYDMLKPNGYMIYSEYVVNPDRQVRSHYFTMKNQIEFKEIFNKAKFNLVSRNPFMQIMNIPAKTKNFFMNANWKLLVLLIEKFPFLSFPIGVSLYPFELLCLKLFKKPIGMEIFVFRK